MEILRNSSLLQDVSALSSDNDNLSSVTEVLTKLNTETLYEDYLEPAIVPAVDAIYEVLTAGSLQAAAIQKLADLAMKPVTEVLEKLTADSISAILEKSPAGQIFQDVLDFLFSSKKDVLSLKSTTLSNLMNDLPVSTDFAYRDAVYKWDRAPRAEDAIHFSLYTAVPVGIVPMIVREALNIADKAAILDTKTGAPMFPIIRGIAANIQSSMKSFYDNNMTSEVVIDGSVIDRRQPLTLAKIGEDTVDNYEWYYRISFGDPPLALFNTDFWEDVSDRKEYQLKFRMYDGPKDVTKKYLKSKSYTIYNGLTTQKTVYFKDIFKEKKASAVFDTLKKPGVIVVAELYHGTKREQQFPLLSSVPNIGGKPAWDVWVSLDALFPSVFDITEFIDNQISELFKSLTQFGSAVDSVVATIIKGITDSVAHVIDVLSMVLELFVSIVRMLNFVDVRYVCFNGSYTDLLTAWSLVKPGFNVDDRSAYKIFNLVATLQSAGIVNALQQLGKKNQATENESTIDEDDTTLESSVYQPLLTELKKAAYAENNSGMPLSIARGLFPDMNVDAVSTTIKGRSTWSPHYIPLETWDPSREG